MRQSNQRRRPLGFGAYVLMMVGVMVVGGVAGAGSAFLAEQSPLVALIGTAALIGAAMLVALAACVWWWRGIDEAAREAHKWAWWWGGCSGMAVGAAVVVTLGLRDDLTVPAAFGSSPADLMASGMMAILLFQLAGYALAWAGWWLKHR